MKKISLIIFIFFCTIVVFEIFLRYSPFSYGITPMTYDKDIGMWHKKDFSGYIIKDCYKTRYSFDEKGRIANSYNYDKNKKDMVLIGDSQVEALMVENNKVMHNSLYKELDGQYNVLNYGLSGTGPSQQLKILKNKVLLKNTDTLIHFVFLENDLNDGDPKNFNGTNRPKVYMKFQDLENYEIIKPRDNDIKEQIRDFLGNFELYVYLKKTIYFYQNKFSSKTKLVKEEIKKTSKYALTNEEYKWKQLNGSIFQINKLALSHNINYKIVIFSTYEASDKHTKKREKFESFLSQYKIQHMNIIPFLNIIKKEHQLGFECDGHWNDVTHQKIAKYLKEKLNK